MKLPEKLIWFSNTRSEKEAQLQYTVNKLIDYLMNKDTTQSNTDWLDEFDFRYVINPPHSVPVVDAKPEDLKSFISQLLEAEKKRWREEVEGMKIENKLSREEMDYFEVQNRVDIYNQALDAVLQKLS